MLTVVSHDAGGAELVSSWLAQYSGEYCLVLDGPAKAIFERKLGRSEDATLNQAIEACDWVLCGTSWQSGLERSAIRQAKASGKKVVAYLDHWVNYRERFQEQGEFFFPDEIWVGDEDALHLAEQQICETPIRLEPNLYFKELATELGDAQEDRLPRERGGAVLYVCEPIAAHAELAYGDERYWGYTETDAMNYFLTHLESLGRPITSIRIRPHPSEPRDKYDWVKQASQSPVVIGGDRPLVEEIAEADIIVGCESMAMVVGLLGEKEVISTIPPNGRRCSLPHKGIQHLQLLVDNKDD